MLRDRIFRRSAPYSVGVPTRTRAPRASAVPRRSRVGLTTSRVRIPAPCSDPPRARIPDPPLEFGVGGLVEGVDRMAVRRRRSRVPASGRRRTSSFGDQRPRTRRSGVRASNAGPSVVRGGPAVSSSRKTGKPSCSKRSSFRRVLAATLRPLRRSPRRRSRTPRRRKSARLPRRHRRSPIARGGPPRGTTQRFRRRRARRR